MLIAMMGNTYQFINEMPKKNTSDRWVHVNTDLLMLIAMMGNTYQFIIRT